MVTIAQGKFSKPRAPKQEAPAQPVRKKVAADPIEKAEADIARFMNNEATSAPPAPEQPVRDRWLEETKKIAEAAPGEATQVIPQIAMDATRVIPQTNLDATRVISRVNMDATQVIPQSGNDATRVLPRTETPAKPVPQPVSQPAAPKTVPVQRRTAAQPPVEETPREEPGFLERNKKPILVGCCAAILILVIAIIAMVISLQNVQTDDGRIHSNVIVAGVNVGGMTPEQAKSAIENSTAYKFNSPMEVVLPDTVLTFQPEDTQVSLNIDAMLEDAYSYGRTTQATGGQYVVDLMPYLQLNAAYIHDALVDYGKQFNSSYSSTSYSMEGTKPGLTADTFSESAPCQTLVLKIGTPGRNLDVEKIYTEVLKAYTENNFRVDASEAPEEKPDTPDLDAIFEEYCSTPVDAYMDMDTFAVTGEVYGYTFDLNAAREKVANANYGDVIRIPMEYMIPEIRTGDLAASLFADILGSAKTPHTNNADRNTNLRLACQAINGVVLQPGDEFSFNDVVGERTEARGYRKAAAYSDGETVSELGGGICQVSSTLYYSALYADLEITARQNHSYVSTYIPMGMDATVSWGGPEFKFRNNTSYPIRIEAEVVDGHVCVRLMGTDKRDYYIEMEYEVAGYLQPETEYKEYQYDNEEGYKDGDVIQKGSTGYVVDTYKKIYDKETKEKIREEYVARSSYRPHNEIIAKVEPKPTEPPTEAPTEAPTTAPTVAPTETPTTAATAAPTEAPTTAATAAPTETPTTAATVAPTETPTEDVAG